MNNPLTAVSLLGDIYLCNLDTYHLVRGGPSGEIWVYGWDARPGATPTVLNHTVNGRFDHKSGCPLPEAVKKLAISYYSMMS